MKYIRVTMPDGSKYDISAMVIAEDRARYYAGKGAIPSELWNKTFQKEYEIAMEDDYELGDWLSNNMNWKDVKKVAKRVMERPILTDEDLQEGIVNGEKEIIEKG